MSLEEWRDIKGFEGLYQVSNYGNVKSLERKAKHWKGGYRTVKERLLKQSSSRGYFFVKLSLDGLYFNKTVHQLVAVAFLKHTPNGHKVVVDHIDNNKENNKISNLQLITHRENLSKDSVSTSKYTGVCWVNSNSKWRAQISMNGKNIYLGQFDCELVAANTYQKALNKINNKNK